MLKNVDCLVGMKELETDSVEAIVTDPPYGIKFMNKTWDVSCPSVEIWQECLRVLKPGGHLLSFSGTRTIDFIMGRIREAGFEIRDTLTWLYGSGFPKSHNIGAGRGTALKPACEFIVMARKPFKGTVAKNVLKHGTGVLNIDECRVGIDKNDNSDWSGSNTSNKSEKHCFGVDSFKKITSREKPQGRWPANLILDEEAGKMLDEQSGDCGGRWGKVSKNKTNSMFFGEHDNSSKISNNSIGDTKGGASRFFYTAKSSKRERNKNCEEVLTWEGLDLNWLTETISLLKKDILDALSTENIEWNTLLSGNNIMEGFPQDIRFIIKTVIKLIIELKTLKSLQPLNIKDITLDAIRTIMEHGLSLAESVENIKQLKKTIINGEMERSALGVSNVVLRMLLKVKEKGNKGNCHSTVKPQKLMQYLIKLVTPPEGTVLDPFMGSGSTGVACKELGFNFIGYEINKEYMEIACKRLNL